MPQFPPRPRPNSPGEPGHGSLRQTLLWHEQTQAETFHSEQHINQSRRNRATRSYFTKVDFSNNASFVWCCLEAGYFGPALPRLSRVSQAQVSLAPQFSAGTRSAVPIASPTPPPCLGTPSAVPASPGCPHGCSSGAGSALGGSPRWPHTTRPVVRGCTAGSDAALATRDPLHGLVWRFPELL